MAHLGGLEMIGTVVLAFAVCAPVFALAGLGLGAAVMTDARREYQFGDYLALRLFTSALGMLVIVGLALAGGYDSSTSLVILVVGVAEMCNSVSDVFHAMLKQHERMRHAAVPLIVRGLLSLTLLAVAVHWTGSLLCGVLAFPIASIITLLAFDLRNASRTLRSELSAISSDRFDRQHTSLKPRWRPRTMLALAWLSLPLGGVVTLIALSTSIPRCMVSGYLGNEALGVMVSIFYLAMIGSRVVTAIGQAAGPRMAKYFAAGNRRAYLWLLAKVSAVVVLLGAAMVATVAMVGVPVLGWLYAADYRPHAELAVYLALAGALMYLTVPLGMAVEAMRRFKSHLIARAAGVAAMSLLLPGLLTGHGLIGAAWAMAAGFAVPAIVCAGVVLWGTNCERQPA